MVIFSTPESVARRQACLLAITETILAIACVGHATILLNTFAIIAIAVIVTPFLLLRTKYSTAIGIKSFEKLHDLSHELSSKIPTPAKGRTLHSALNFARLVIVNLIILSPILGTLPIRVYATVLGVIRHPKKSIKAIPDNWYRSAIVMDSLHPAEVVAGYHSAKVECDQFQEKSIYDLATAYDGPNRINLLLIKSVTRILSTIYRLSLKSTSIVYLPLLWIAESHLPRRRASVPSAVEQITESQAEKIKRIYAFFVFISFLIPVYLSIKFEPFWQKHSDNPLFEYFFVSGKIDSWHITRLLSALTTWILFLYADRLSIQSRHDDYLILKDTHIKLVALLICRTLFSAWTILWGGYIVFTTIDPNLLPGVRLLPEPVASHICELFGLQCQ